MKIKNKKIITLLAVLALSIFFVINFADAVTCPDTTNWDRSSGVCIPTNTDLPNPGGSNDDPVAIVAMNIMKWITRIIGAIGIISFAISGIQYMLSAGNDSAIESAKKNMKWSIVGVVVALMGAVIIRAVDSMLSGTDSFF